MQTTTVRLQDEIGSWLTSKPTDVPSPKIGKRACGCRKIKDKQDRKEKKKEEEEKRVGFRGSGWKTASYFSLLPSHSLRVKLFLLLFSQIGSLPFILLMSCPTFSFDKPSEKIAVHLITRQRKKGKQEKTTGYPLDGVCFFVVFSYATTPSWRSVYLWHLFPSSFLTS